MSRPSDNQPHRLPIALGRPPSAHGAGDGRLPSGHGGGDSLLLSVPAIRDSSAEPVSPEESEEALLQVGDLARLCGKTVRAIHLYEELGLLRPHARSKGRYRLFSHDAVVRVRWIGKLQELGLSLPTIQGALREWEASPSAPGAMAKMREVYRQKLESTREQIRRLQALETELADSLKYLETCDTCSPIRLTEACTCCDLHADDQLQPELVAGFHVT